MTWRAVPDTFGFDICSFSGFRGIEQTQTFRYAARTYARLKSVLSLGYAKTTRAVSTVRGDLVLNVFSRRNITQIFQSVIIAVPVYVVHVILRPLAFRVKPNKAVRAITLTVDPNDAVTTIVYGSCNAANHYSTISFDAPAQDAGCQIADKQFVKAVTGKHTHSPMVLSYLVNQFTSTVKAP
jgi:hypothetical protein